MTIKKTLADIAVVGASALLMLIALI